MPTVDEPFYRATVRDADGAAGLVFSLRPPSAADRPNDKAKASETVQLEIDPQTGGVRLTEEPADSQQRQAKFTVVVTDPTGLTDERTVHVTW
ncbi:MAG: hypothetical protein WED27_01230 [Pirellulales bacterium]